MTESFCPGCGSKMLNSLYTIETDHNLKTKHKRRWKKSEIVKCLSCKIFIPTSPDVRFWNGSQIMGISDGA